MMRSPRQPRELLEFGAPMKQFTEKTNLLSILNETTNGKNGYQTISLSEKRHAKHISDGSFLPNGMSSMAGVYYNFMNSLVGAGILGLPYVYPSTGLFGGILLQFVFAILSIYTLKILIKSAQKLNVHDYEQLGYKCFGNMGYIIVVSCLFLQDFGTMLNYLIIIGDSSFKIIQIWGYNTEQYRQIILLFVCFVLIFPPCLLRDIAFYEKFSFIKLITIIVVVSVIIYEYVVHSDNNNNNNNINQLDITYFNLAGFPRALGIVAYTFEVHDAAFLYYNTLLNPTIKRWTELSIYGVSSAIILCLSLSIPAYLTFGNNICSNVLNSYDINSIMVVIARIVYAITMALSYPSAFFVVRHVVYMSYQKIVFAVTQYKRKKRIMQNVNVNTDTDYEFDMNESGPTFEDNSFTIKTSPSLHHGMVTFLLFGTNISIALYIDNLGIALSLVGCVASVNLIFILPAVFYWKCCDKMYAFWRYDGPQNKYDAFKDIYGSIAIVILGASIGIIGIYSVLFGL